MLIRHSTCLRSAVFVYFLFTVCAGLSVFGRFVSFVRADEVCDALKSPVNEKLSPAEAKISEFLQSNGTGGKFHVQGWRWHTMSLVREAGRLQKLAVKLQKSDLDEDLSSLKKASEYVVGFNMKGLHRIERDLFFPWFRKKIDSAMNDAETKKAFKTMLDQLESDSRTVEKLGQAVTELAKVASDPSASGTARSEAVSALAAKSKAIAEYAHSMLRREDSLLVPAVAKLVSESEQKSFNNKVIRNLGILDSRLHLVGMHEAVWDLNDEKERTLFKETIPSIPQYMIPRWKRLLYEPTVGELNKV